MRLALKKMPHLGVKEQIKGQIKGLIESGSLQPGASLPSSRDLALTLGVNRNTTWAAYRELINEGLLSASVGSGTYVKTMKTKDRAVELSGLIDEMLSKAQSMGYDRDTIADRFLSRLACQSVKGESHRILVVECNRETGQHLAECLEQELTVSTEVMLIQEIEQTPGRARRRLKEFDLVVCGFNHLKEFQAAVPDSPIEAVGVLMRPDWQALEILKTLPPGSAVGLTCANHRSTETLFKDVIYDSGSTLKRIWFGMEDSDGARELMKECRVVMASNYVYERVKSIAHPGTEVVMVELKPDKAGIAMVRSYLEDQ
jgi:DNA-binding transcriptional regulator YhcF (GntR family)